MTENTTIRIAKPLLDTNGQIDHLIKKGVQFRYITTEDARKYLEENNNYFRLRSFRKNFDKHPAGENEGKYINLDFAMLKDLSIIDMRLRYVLLKLVLDVEHFSKVRLLKTITEKQEDGYQIVDDYFESIRDLDTKTGSSRYAQLENELNRNRNNPYCGGIIDKYDNNYPVWAFIEVIPMGSFIHFYEFCSNRLNDGELKDIAHLMKTVKDLRNAAAHSNCILHNMRAQDSPYRPNYQMLQKLSSISKHTRDKKLRNEHTREITTLLYVHWLLVTSKGVHERAKNDLQEITNRMFKNIEYYDENDVIKTNFDFFKKTVDIFFE